MITDACGTIVRLRDDRPPAGRSSACGTIVPQASIRPTGVHPSCRCPSVPQASIRPAGVHPSRRRPSVLTEYIPNGNSLQFETDACETDGRLRNGWMPAGQLHACGTIVPQADDRPAGIRPSRRRPSVFSAELTVHPRSQRHCQVSSFLACAARQSK